METLDVCRDPSYESLPEETCDRYMFVEILWLFEICFFFVQMNVLLEKGWFVRMSDLYKHTHTHTHPGDFLHHCSRFVCLLPRKGRARIRWFLGCHSTVQWQWHPLSLFFGGPAKNGVFPKKSSFFSQGHRTTEARVQLGPSSRLTEEAVQRRRLRAGERCRLGGVILGPLPQCPDTERTARADICIHLLKRILFFPC